MLKADEEITGQRLALGYTGSLATTPIAWGCDEHRDLFESESSRDLLTLVWPRLDIERVETPLRARSSKGRKCSGENGNEGGCKRR